MRYYKKFWVFLICMALSIQPGNILATAEGSEIVEQTYAFEEGKIYLAQGNIAIKDGKNNNIEIVYGDNQAISYVPYGETIEIIGDSAYAYNHTITVNTKREMNVCLSNVNINVSELSEKGAVSILGDSSVNLEIQEKSHIEQVY